MEIYTSQKKIEREKRHERRTEVDKKVQKRFIRFLGVGLMVLALLSAFSTASQESKKRERELRVQKQMMIAELGEVDESRLTVPSTSPVLVLFHVVMVIVTVVGAVGLTLFQEWGRRIIIYEFATAIPLSLLSLVAGLLQKGAVDSMGANYSVESGFLAGVFLFNLFWVGVALWIVKRLMAPEIREQFQ